MKLTLYNGKPWKYTVLHVLYFIAFPTCFYLLFSENWLCVIPIAYMVWANLFTDARARTQSELYNIYKNNPGLFRKEIKQWNRENPFHKI